MKFQLLLALKFSFFGNWVVVIGSVKFDFTRQAMRTYCQSNTDQSWRQKKKIDKAFSIY
jgi:hypothetical protein